MPQVKLSPVLNEQTLTSTGAPASGYKVFTYAAGSSTLLATYTDSTGSVAQLNPVLLNASGYPTNGPIWLQTGLAYKMVLTDASGSVIRTIDNVTGVNDSSSSTSQWLSSGVTPTYVSASSFTLPGDQTTEFHVGRRVQFTVTAGTVYGTISSSAYAASTTIGVTMDSGMSLDSGLSVVNLSILRADKSALPTAPTPATGDSSQKIATTAFVKTNPSAVKAWVNFDGTLAGTITPRANYNVSSVTKNATGDYTLNFTSALTDANYAVSGMINDSVNAAGSGIHIVSTGGSGAAATKTTTALRVGASFVSGGAGTAGDFTNINIAIFGN